MESGVTFPPLPTFEWEEDVDGCGEGGFEVNMPVAGMDPFYPVGEGAYVTSFGSVGFCILY